MIYELGNLVEHFQSFDQNHQNELGQNTHTVNGISLKKNISR